MSSPMLSPDGLLVAPSVIFILVRISAAFVAVHTGVRVFVVGLYAVARALRTPL